MYTIRQGPLMLVRWTLNVSTSGYRLLIVSSEVLQSVVNEGMGCYTNLPSPSYSLSARRRLMSRSNEVPLSLAA